MNSQVAALIKIKLGEAAAAAYVRIRADPELGPLLVEKEGPLGDIDQALRTLAAVLARALPVTEVVEPLKVVFERLGSLLGLRPPGGRSAPLVGGMKAEGLPEALEQCLALKQRYPVILSGFRADPVIWGRRLARITLLAGLNAALQAFHRVVAAELNRERAAAVRDLRDAFAEVRLLVAGQLPEEDWRRVAAYLYGAAEKAVKRTRENKDAQQALQEKARAQVSLASKREAREAAAKELESLAQDLLHKAPVQGS